MEKIVSSREFTAGSLHIIHDSYQYIAEVIFPVADRKLLAIHKPEVN